MEKTIIKEENVAASSKSSFWIAWENGVTERNIEGETNFERAAGEIKRQVGQNWQSKHCSGDMV